MDIEVEKILDELKSLHKVDSLGLPAGDLFDPCYVYWEDVKKIIDKYGIGKIS